jgi:predicted  nucleic acid-binding Zn-ribbon protein
MSCMEHHCSCGFAAFNNEARTPSICPKCGNDSLLHLWDEQEDYNRERAERAGYNNEDPEGDDAK